MRLTLMCGHIVSCSIIQYETIRLEVTCTCVFPPSFRREFFCHNWGISGAFLGRLPVIAFIFLVLFQFSTTFFRMFRFPIVKASGPSFSAGGKDDIDRPCCRGRCGHCWDWNVVLFHWATIRDLNV